MSARCIVRARRHGVIAVLLLGSVLLAGCQTAPAPTAPAPTATPAAPTPANTATRPPAPEPTAAALAPTATAAPGSSPSDLPPGWQVRANQQLTIALPPGWQAVELAGADAQTTYDALRQSDPLLADILGGPEALTAAAFWAFAPQPVGQDVTFVDNLNIRRSPLGAQPIPDMQDVISVLLPEYEKLGLAVTSVDATLDIGGFPAARITYTLTSSIEGQPAEIRGRQYIVATDTDLWVLSYTTIPEREGALAADFETSAQSFSAIGSRNQVSRRNLVSPWRGFSLARFLPGAQTG